MPTRAPSAASSVTTWRMSSIHSGAKARSSSLPGRVGLSPMPLWSMRTTR